MARKKTVRYEIEREEAEMIYSFLEEKGYQIENVDGVLMDSFFCEVGACNYKFRSRTKLRNFVMVVETYVNEWSSKLELILTDSKKYYEKMLNELSA